MNGAHVCTTGDYRAGDPPPRGYPEWHEWARVQHAAGLRQVCCSCCTRYRFPQEIDHVERVTLLDRAGNTVARDLPVCRNCARLHAGDEPEKRARGDELEGLI